MFKRLQQALRAKGYNGPMEAEAIRKWCEAEAFDLALPDGKTVDGIIKEGPEKLALAAPEPETAKAPEPDTKRAPQTLRIDAANAGSENAGAQHVTPKNLRAIAARKRYDAKAAKGETKYSTSEVAEIVTAGLRLSIGRPWTEGYPQKQSDLDIVGKAWTTVGANGAQSFVPDEFSDEVVMLFNEYAGDRQLITYKTMSRDTYVENKVTALPTVYYPGEGVATTESTPTTTPISMTAKSGHTLSKISNELFQESAVNVADALGRAVALAWGYDEENKFINGDGTSTYNNFLGWIGAMSAVGVTNATNASIQDASGNAWSAITQDDFLGCVGRMPTYALKGGRGPKWAMSRVFYYAVALREAYGLSGDAVQRFIMSGGDQNPMLLGYPVVFCDTMRTASTASKIMALFGNFDLGCIAGEVYGSFRLVSSDQRYFDTAEVGIRSDRRWALSVHAPGTSTVAGPVIGLATTA